MILEPRFFAVPESIWPMPIGATFNILWFAKADEYTLIGYRYRTTDSVFESEILYQGNECIWDDMFAGKVPLQKEADPAITAKSADPRSRLPQNMGALGIPSGVASELRRGDRRVVFQI